MLCESVSGTKCPGVKLNTWYAFVEENYYEKDAICYTREA